VAIVASFRGTDCSRFPKTGDRKLSKHTRGPTDARMLKRESRRAVRPWLVEGHSDSQDVFPRGRGRSH
jgi:hypothetical protein